MPDVPIDETLTPSEQLRIAAAIVIEEEISPQEQIGMEAGMSFILYKRRKW